MSVATVFGFAGPWPILAGPSLALSAAAADLSIAQADLLLAQVDLLQSSSTLAVVVGVVGFSLLALTVSTLATVCFRWYFRSKIPTGLAVLLGVGAVGVYLNTTDLLGTVIGTPPADADPFATSNVLKNVLTLFVAALVAPAGIRIGEAAVRDALAVPGVRELDEIGRIVRSAGRVTTVELPAAADVEDMENYDPVASEVKERLGGKTLVFPSRLGAAELRDRLATRLKEDYEVGYVDVDLEGDGTVRYLALGSRVAGLGPTLGPGTRAVAVEADPAHGASPGDVVQVWTAGDDPTRVATAELRSTAGDVVTLVVDEADAPRFDGTTAYRLVTLPASPRADREFVSLLRAADETLGVARVGAASSLVGASADELDATVVAVRGADGSLDTLPRRTRTLAAGDDVYAVGRPEALRRLELAASEDGSAGATPGDEEADDRATRAAPGDDPAR